jgi:hypothetical protein
MGVPFDRLNTNKSLHEFNLLASRMSSWSDIPEFTMQAQPSGPHVNSQSRSQVIPEIMIPLVGRE